MGETFRIDALGAQGDGIAAGRGVFIPYTLPGEEVRALPRGDRATLEAVLTPSTERVDPECPHYMACGGCTLQHAADPFIARWKRQIILDALASRGIDAPEVRPTLTSPPGTRRRITVSGKRTKKGVLIGFHAPRSEEIVPISACLVSDPALVDTVPALTPLVRIGASRKGALRIALTASDYGTDASVTEAKELDGPERAQLAGLAAEAGLARLAWNGEVVVTRAPPAQRMGRASVIPPPGGFLQATPAGEAALAGAISEAVGEASRVADLFAGVGPFALRLAETAEVLAVDTDGEALSALDAAWRAAEGLKRITTQRRDLFARPLRPEELNPFEAVVLDPPRAGARAQAEQLAASSVPRIAMASCHPATFARDARVLMDGGFQLDWVQPIDQFRWSDHVELAAQLSRT